MNRFTHRLLTRHLQRTMTPPVPRPVIDRCLMDPVEAATRAWTVLPNEANQEKRRYLAGVAEVNRGRRQHEKVSSNPKKIKRRLRAAQNQAEVRAMEIVTENPGTTNKELKELIDV